MKKPLYINSHGKISRKGNTLFFKSMDDDKKTLPVHAINEIHAHGKVSITSGAATILMKEGIPVNFYNKYAYYEGSLYPKINLNSGHVIVKQSEHYSTPEKRNFIASEFVKAIQHNTATILKYYIKKDKKLDFYLDNIESENITGNIPQIMSCEGRVWNNFYQSFNEILKRFEFDKREIRPPTTELNAMISFGNSLLYGTCLSEIYHTYLHPSISFLHEPAERRFSLALDLADIFKPIIVSRTIFKLVNNNQITEKHFEKDIGVLLNEKGRQIFLTEYQKKLETTIQHQTLNKKVSYKYLIRLECYKLIKHILGDKTYESFRMWW
ncbi:MAG: type I-B CRISPR-associated endonuclease Cas1b [Methanobrevibacter sp.]|jgi:CRISPR-associated protein Cas1|nr:type I-B CRISPR-associated endonuclease Cas1b [Candidatus Methanoflexus mossambicus]